jgi:monoterpene epsilon-lactone hydrolase
MKFQTRAATVLLLVLICIEVAHAGSPPQLSVTQRTFGAQTIEVPAFELPPSELLSKASIDELRWWANMSEAVLTRCSYSGRTPAEIIAARRCLDQFYFPALLQKHKRKYSVEIKQRMIGGIPTEEFMPTKGVLRRNRGRVLINLHGGSFQVMGRWGGEVESIPIAAVARIKVVSVDYRMAPEAKFPAASEDVAAVYRALLSQYRPEDIGIYGCSAGGILTAEAMAWFQKEGLPSPGAVGMFCGAAVPPESTDSTRFMAAVLGSSESGGAVIDLPYFKGADPKSPLVYPGLDSTVLAKFPPSLLISGTRDPLLSSVLSTHAKLVSLGVKADLHVWEGQVHGFLFDPDMEESQSAYKVIAKFFDENLAVSKSSGK